MIVSSPAGCAGLEALGVEVDSSSGKDSEGNCESFSVYTGMMTCDSPFRRYLLIPAPLPLRFPSNRSKEGSARR